MYKKINLITEHRTFSYIMGNAKTYAIPQFQRDYSWDGDEINDLWQDIEQMRVNETQHFMGYVVFQTEDDKAHQIIDGQQRLTTLNLYIIAVLACLQEKIDKGEDAEYNQRRVETIRTNYIGFLDTITLRTKPKLILNRNNKGHFQDIIAALGKPQKRNVIATNRKLNRGFELFKSNLDALNLSGEELAEHVESVADGLTFIILLVEDDLNAYLVFETLNARGVQLSSPDLLKNYLLSTVAKDRPDSTDTFDTFDERWEAILMQLSESNFTDFLRSHVGISHVLPYKKNLYRDLKRTVTNSKEVFDYLSEIEKNAPLYTALGNAEDSFWNDFGSGRYDEAKPYITTLKHFHIKTPMSLLMSAFAAYEKTPKDFIKILQWITAISIRYNVIGQKLASEQERLYNELANELYKKPTLKPADIKPRLESIYPNDAEFESAFKFMKKPSETPNKTIVFLLSQIEKHLNPEYTPSLGMTLEHILPKNPDDAWQEAFGRDSHIDAIDRLGNLTILTDEDNMGQEPFSKKREVLGKSSLALNKKIAKYKSWDMESLTEYQGWLASHAISVWKIEGL